MGHLDDAHDLALILRQLEQIAHSDEVAFAELMALIEAVSMGIFGAQHLDLIGDDEFVS